MNAWEWKKWTQRFFSTSLCVRLQHEVLSERTHNKRRLISSRKNLNVARVANWETSMKKEASFCVDFERKKFNFFSLSLRVNDRKKKSLD